MPPKEKGGAKKQGNDQSDELYSAEKGNPLEPTQNKNDESKEDDVHPAIDPLSKFGGFSEVEFVRLKTMVINGIETNRSKMKESPKFARMEKRTVYVIFRSIYRLNALNLRECVALAWCNAYEFKSVLDDHFSLPISAYMKNDVMRSMQVLSDADLELYNESNEDLATWYSSLAHVFGVSDPERKAFQFNLSSIGWTVCTGLGIQNIAATSYENNSFAPKADCDLSKELLRTRDSSLRFFPPFVRAINADERNKDRDFKYMIQERDMTAEQTALFESLMSAARYVKRKVPLSKTAKKVVYMEDSVV